MYWELSYLLSNQLLQLAIILGIMLQLLAVMLQLFANILAIMLQHPCYLCTILLYYGQRYARLLDCVRFTRQIQHQKDIIDDSY